MTASYVVTAPLVIVRNPEQSGRQEYLYAGSPIPSYVVADDVARLVEDGMVAKVGGVVVPATTPAEVDATSGVAKAEPSGPVPSGEARRTK